ncbi:leukocyte tyrosine kinase receptor isoform X1 [Sus scrofa]|uniref:leukocyte tyrosine kinase receptor isoform X1 n=1 Tax=Sus scrofa TaxID=9823 RepID=UPI000A2B7CF0|nr:leukocyte tyrosine kinase receptor isoform X1 [Sus scrofa]
MEVSPVSVCSEPRTIVPLERSMRNRDIASRNCLLNCSGPTQVAKMGDFKMARDTYRLGLSGCCSGRPSHWATSPTLGAPIRKCWTLSQRGQKDSPRGCPGLCEYGVLPRVGGLSQPWAGMNFASPQVPYTSPSSVGSTSLNSTHFSSISEHLPRCTQDSDVLNSPLPMELGPILKEEGTEQPIFEGPKIPTDPGMSVECIKELRRKPP